MIRKYKVKNNIIFSYIFSHSDILKSFLENVIDEKIESLEVENQFRLDRNNFSEKLCVLDIKAVINKGTFVDVEMQKNIHHSYLKRVYLYFGSIAKLQVKKGIKKTQIQVIKAMLKENADINFICKVTGLSEDEIKNIAKNNY